MQIGDFIAIDGKSIKARERKSDFVSPFWAEGKNEKPAGVLCFPFHEIKWSNGCTFDCDYCYLRGTFPYGIDMSVPNSERKPWRGNEQIVFSNIDVMFAEVESMLKIPFLKPTVFHTGELADSLAMPGSEHIMIRLIEMFAKQDRHTLLLLTKSANVDELLIQTAWMNEEEKSRTVIAFSINAIKAAQQYEKAAATTQQRLEAAEKCIAANFKVMIRVDPMIPIDNWQHEYSKLFEYINELTYEGLYGVVVGTLRAFGRTKQAMPAEMQQMLQTRDVDRRYHIDNATRDEMYDLAFKTLKSKRIGVCKESGEMWGSLIKKHGPRNFVCNCHL